MFAIDYRLARPGQPSWPSVIGDLREAVRWVRRHSGEFGVDPREGRRHGPICRRASRGPAGHLARRPRSRRRLVASTGGRQLLRSQRPSRLDAVPSFTPRARARHAGRDQPPLPPIEPPLLRPSSTSRPTIRRCSSSMARTTRGFRSTSPSGWRPRSPSRGVPAPADHRGWGAPRLRNVDRVSPTP